MTAAWDDAVPGSTTRGPMDQDDPAQVADQAFEARSAASGPHRTSYVCDGCAAAVLRLVSGQTKR